MTPGGPKVAREESLVQQGLLAIAGGGVTLSISAYQKKDVAWRNAAKGVGELDRNGAPLGNHLGPTDALRHCSWSALVMLAALKEDSPQTGLLDAVSGIGAPRIPSPSSLLSTSPASGVHLFPTARERTRAVLLSHEIAGSGTGTSDSKMDQANNETGMALAETLWQQGKRDDASICQAAIGALESGALKMFDIDGNLISTAGWRGSARTPGSTTCSSTSSRTPFRASRGRGRVRSRRTSAARSPPAERAHRQRCPTKSPSPGGVILRL